MPIKLAQGDMVCRLKPILREVPTFCQFLNGRKLRSYQEAVALAIVQSVIKRQGLSFAVMFPRQSGKNEVQALIEAYLLVLFMEAGGEIIKVSPTWRPQSQNAMRRLERVLTRNPLTQMKWKKESGYIYRVDQAGIIFLSGAPEANIVGATASILLEVDEAQSLSIAKYDRDIAPMASSTNATRVFWGTAWTSQTLLARELRAAQAAERADGVRRVFVMSAEQVSREVPAYGRFVAEQVARLGRHHPVVKTQFFSEELDGEAGMFPPARRALMQGQHVRRSAPEAGRLYALLVDVAGEDEAAPAPGEQIRLANPARDATALTVVEVDTSTLSDEALRAPTYRVVDRRIWVGVRHTALYAQIKALAETWRAQRVVVDATGVGAGLASFLEKALPGKVTPFVFNSNSKSKLGWDFLAIVETGRFKDWADPGDGREDERELFWRQVAACECHVYPGPTQRLRWGVPEGSRDPSSGELLHDDLLLSAALCAALEELAWSSPGGGAVLVRRADVLKDIDREGF